MMRLLVLLALAGWAQAQAASYAPVYGSCPSSSVLRLANNGSLSQSESTYITSRLSAIKSNFTTYAQKAGYSISAAPRIGIALSGGGYRASLFGAGVLSAFDALNTSSPVAGVLQNAAYLSGLSGGSWTVGSYSLSNAAPAGLYDLVYNNPGWELDRNLVLPAGATGLITGDNEEFFNNLQADVTLKEQAGANTSITDYWGRALSYHFFNGTDASNFYDRPNASSHAAGLLFSDITAQPAFTNYRMPFPIIVATSRPPGQRAQMQSFYANPIPLTSVNYEFNPYEFGSSDPRLAAFVEMVYLGSELYAGTPINSTACPTAYDNAGFVIGTSASLFNAILNTINSTLSSADAAVIEAIFNKIDGGVRNDMDDVSNLPNSFRGLSPSTFQDTASYELELTDGGEDGQNVPILPLLTPARQVDAIIAVDASADTNDNYANGTSIITTAAKVAVLNNTVAYPPVPATPSDLMVNGYARPWFFGCNGTASTNSSAASNSTNYPMMVYLPSQSISGYMVNVSTFQLDYTNAESQSLLDGANQIAARGLATNGAADSNWPTCVACALTERQRQRDGLARSSQCSSCFSTYCYTGPTAARNDTTPQIASSSASSGNSGSSGSGSSSGASISAASSLSAVALGAVAAILGLTR